MFPRNLFRFIVVWLMFGFAGCGGGVEDPVIAVDEDDPEMVAAIAEAKANVQQFIDALSNPTATQSDFAVKFPVTDGDQVEHMWLMPVRYENGKFRGVINNEPQMVTNVKLGDEVEVAPGEISDWMYFDNDDFVGGYSVKLLMQRESEQ